MTPLDKPVTRKTHHEYFGKKLVVCISPSGIALRPERSGKAVKIDFLALYTQLVAEERRGGQSDISIAPRKGRRS